MADLAPLAEARPALQRATASNRRLGEEIAAHGQVEFAASEGSVSARVSGPPGTSRRTVTFVRAEGAVAWRCTCTRAASPLCKHVVAALLAADRT